MTRYLPAIVFFVAFGVFLHGAAPTIQPLDSAELSAVGATLGIAHAPGYPLYSLAAKAWSSLVALGNGAYRTNVFSAACSAGALALLSAAFAAEGRVAMLAAPLALYVMPAFQKEAVGAEVFALNTLFAALLVFLAKTRSRDLVLAVFVFALGLGNQHTLLMAVPLLFAFLPGTTSTEKVSPDLYRRLAACAGVAALAGAVYLFLILRAKTGPVMDWEEPDTLVRFWKLVTRARYGTLALAQGGTETAWEMARVNRSINLYAAIFEENLGLLRLAACAGLGYLAFTRSSLLTPLLAAWALSGPAFFVLTKMESGNGSELIMERFLPLSGVFAAAAVAQAASWLPKPYTPAFLLLFAGYLPFAAVSARDSYVLADFARDHLRTLPEPAVLIADRADEVEFATAYLHAAEGRRPGLRFIDANAGVTPSIYGPDYYGIWGKPRLEIRDTVEGDLVAASSVPVYYATVLPRQTKVAKTREGLLWRAKGLARVQDRTPFYVLRRSPELPLRERVLAWSLYRQLGEDALERGDLAGADNAFTGAAVYGRDAGYEYHWAGVALLERGQAAQAARLIQRSLEYRSDPLAFSNWGAALEQVGDVDGALKAYRRAVQVGPNSAIAHRNLGSACWKVQEWECAAAAFSRAAALDPSDKDLPIFAAKAKLRIKR